MIVVTADFDCQNQLPVAMPRIDTSSDMYQNRDRSLTTYKKDLDHAVAYKDLPRPDEKQRVREKQRDVANVKNQAMIEGTSQADSLKTDPFKSGLSKSEVSRDEQKRLLERQRTESLYPTLYEPRTAPRDRPVDASSFITGGTVDVRA